MEGQGQQADFKQEAHTKLITDPDCGKKEKFTVEREARLEKVNTTDVNTGISQDD